RLRRPRVELRAPPAGRDDEADLGSRLHTRDRSVAAPSVGDHDLVPAARRRERLQQPADLALLVERRDDEAALHARGPSSRASACPVERVMTHVAAMVATRPPQNSSCPHGPAPARRPCASSAALVTSEPRYT